MPYYCAGVQGCFGVPLRRGWRFVLDGDIYTAWTWNLPTIVRAVVRIVMQRDLQLRATRVCFLRGKLHVLHVRQLPWARSM